MGGAWEQTCLLHVYISRSYLKQALVCDVSLTVQVCEVGRKQRVDQVVVGLTREYRQKGGCDAAGDISCRVRDVVRIRTHPRHRRILLLHKGHDDHQHGKKCLG